MAQRKAPTVDTNEWRIWHRRVRYQHYRLDAEVNDRNLVPYPARVTIDVLLGQEPKLTGICLSASDSGTITASGMREIRLALMVVVCVGIWQDYVEEEILLDQPLPDESQSRQVQAVAMYRRALARGSRRPTQDAADALHLSRPYVARLLMDARRSGLLGPAQPGKGGES